MATYTIGDASVDAYSWTEEPPPTISASYGSGTTGSYIYTVGTSSAEQEVETIDDKTECVTISGGVEPCVSFSSSIPPCIEIIADYDKPQEEVLEETDLLPHGIQNIRAVHATSVSQLYLYCEYSDPETTDPFEWHIIEVIYVPSAGKGITANLNVWRTCNVHTNWFSLSDTADENSICSIMGVDNNRTGDVLCLVENYGGHNQHYMFDLTLFDSAIPTQDDRNISLRDIYSRRVGFQPDGKVISNMADGGSFWDYGTWVDGNAEGCGLSVSQPITKILAYDSENVAHQSDLGAWVFWDIENTRRKIEVIYSNTRGNLTIYADDNFGRVVYVTGEANYTERVVTAENPDECQYSAFGQIVEVIDDGNQNGIRERFYNSWYTGYPYFSNGSHHVRYWQTGTAGSSITQIPTNTLDTTITGFYLVHCDGTSKIYQHSVTSDWE